MAVTIPTFDVEFRLDGQIHAPGQVSALVGGLAGATDLFVVSHGWNNDMAEARQLYGALLGNIAKIAGTADAPALPAPLRAVLAAAAGRSFAALQIFWPSKKFADADLIPGGGAATATAENRRAVERVLEDLKRSPRLLGDATVDPVRAATIDRARDLLSQVADDRTARREYVFLLRTILDPAAAHADDGSAEFFVTDPETLFDELSGEVMAPPPARPGGATSIGNAGGAAALGDLLEGALAAARRLANFATYYQMKARAGTVGSTGVATVLREVRRARPDIRLHLVGHSFGGRLVTAAAHALDPGTPKVSMCLLQAAFSHNGFSGGFGTDHEVGFFRDVIASRRISGPIAITHTKNDTAVGIAYPLASRIARQRAAALGDENDPYGGMGRNGAQNTAEAQGQARLMGKPGADYAFQANRIHNVKADVVEHHGDVARIEVAFMVLCAATAVP
jgi:hypothetical protein